MAVYSLGERKVAFHGEEWFIAHNATVIGTVILHNQASVWFNAVVRGDNDIITIGERSNIQDAAVLHVDPGVPLTLGKVVRELEPEEVEELLKNADIYVRRSKLYREKLKPRES